MKAIRNRLMLFSGITASLILTLAFVAGPASASPSKSSAAGYCYTVIAKINPPAPASRVVARHCYATSAKASVAESQIPDTETSLVTFYQNEGYTGNSDTIYGKNGPCDPSGYGLSNLSYENSFVVGGISSYKTHNSCGGQSYYKLASYGQFCKTFYNTFALNYVGALCNDDLQSMKVWDSS
jgi:hypothetical protein